MEIRLSLFVAILAFSTLTLAKPETVEHGAEAHKSHHFKGGIHNPVFDIEALLGSRNNEDLAELSGEQRTKRLRILARSHDKNNDDIIESKELSDWVLQSFSMLDHEEASEKFVEDDINSDGKVTFAEILEKQYSYTEKDVQDIEAKHKAGKLANDEDGEEEREMIKLVEDDRTRFTAADLNKDQTLDRTEFVAFLQPYDFPHMFGVEIQRIMKDMDKDNDGFVSLVEFIGDVNDDETRLSEQTNFEELDKDKDGKLTPEELKPWALPDNADMATEEVEHLVKECDENGDGKLSIDEIVSKEDEFFGSSATDYGRHLSFVKEEL